MNKTASNPGFGDRPHRRFNPLKSEWVLVSPHRNNRPWLGQIETPVPPSKPAHDVQCYLCAGNTRINGEINPDYRGPHVFQNDFPALYPKTEEIVADDSDLFSASTVQGTARVICFSERHDQTLPEMSVESIRQVVDTWIRQIVEFGEDYAWVGIFENKGEMMGCSNPHPHGQVWASDFLPNEIVREDQAQFKYFKKHGSPLLLDYGVKEGELGERIVVENESWLAVVPYWATWPFETLLVPRRYIRRLPDVDDREKNALADILKRLTTRYDNLFETEFPYSMGWHGAPTTEAPSEHWQLHAHFYPPLLRSATVRKFMVGYELLAEAQRDMTAETAAEHLRALSDQHYKSKRLEAEA